MLWLSFFIVVGVGVNGTSSRVSFELDSLLSELGLSVVAFSIIGAVTGTARSKLVLAILFSSVSMRAITVPMGTTALGSYKISITFPATVDGISLSTLSVAMSNKVSSNWMVSPTLLCHFKMVASMILSPSLGKTKSTIGIRVNFSKNKTKFY